MANRINGLGLILALPLVLALSASYAAAAPANSNVGIINLNASVPESLTVTLGAGTNVNFTLVPNTAANNGSTTSSVTTSWALKPGRNKIAVWAYFTSATAALTPLTAGNTVTIPSAAVKIQVDGAGGFNPCSSVSPFNAAASGLLVGTTNIVGNSNINGSRTDTLAYQIDTTVTPQLPADTYIGVLNIQAQVTP
ncbi:MAG TPA: hypothetical protein VKT29_09140 [Terriglobales bacterium]|nr:hypothetical protein [Terriglobales bacterium]